ncbi:MAG: glycosyl hydrolase family 57, partial [Actinomycetota bacterium]|nr:glycosyl hydrolase family 57 [Actinomycetota bacterium]
VISELQAEDTRFHVDGGSWTNDISWVRGYDHLLMPMERSSALFHERVLSRAVPTDDHRYRNTLFHLLTAETSCYRYWGEGVWTDYGAEIARRANEIITNDL